MNYRKVGIYTAGTVAVIAVVVLFTRSPRTEHEETTAISAEVPVSVAAVQKQRLTSTLSLVGTISATNDVNVISETQGVVRKVFVKVGSPVAAGDVLVQVDDEIPSSSAAAAEINYQKAKRDYERSETLYQENSISPAQLDAARLGMKSAENQLNIARRQLENTRIKTPIGGTVNTRQVEVGTMVQPGMPVANIVDITTLKVNVNVSEREAFALHPGDIVEIETDVYPGVKFEGRVDNIASKADEAHTYPLEIRLPNSKLHPLKAGMFGRVSFRSVSDEPVLAISRMALVGSIRKAQVYTVRNGVASINDVTVGRQTNELLEILDGLLEGDTIVTSGQNNLSDGMRVKVVRANEGITP